MIANYHTHTWRCNHATGSEREYVECAIKSGLKILGFSDHTPQPYAGDYKSLYKMTMEQLPGYVDTVLQLKEEYKNDIEIHLGLETEYYPRYWEELRSYIREFPIEYMILGQHFLGNEENDAYSGDETKDPVILRRYVDQVIEAMETGSFTYLAHPDLLYFTGDDAYYAEQMKRLALAAKACNVPLEINCLGIEDQRNYPDDRFWPIVKEVGNDVVIGSDAHTPQDVYNLEGLKRAEEIVAQHNLPLLQTVSFKKP